MIKKGKTKIVTKLSFDAEDAGWSSGDEGKGEGEFQLKKSKQSRQVKKMKMKQSASILVQETIPIVTESNGPALAAGLYSKEYLASLRSEQKFKVKEEVEEPFSDSGVMELCGEEAEQFVEAIAEQSKAAANLEGDFIPFSSNQPSRDPRDLNAIRSARVVNKSLLRNQDSGRIYTSDLHKDFSSSSKASKDFILEAPVVDVDNEDWEDELLKRGAFSAAFTASHTSKIHNQKTGSTSTSKVRVQVVSNKDNDVTVANDQSREIMKSLRFAMDKLTTSISSAQRAKSQLNVEIVKCQEVESTLNAGVESGVRKLHTMEDVKLYFADVVGMLREKVDAIKELRSSTIAQAKAIGEFILSSRLEEQEDIVFRVKEAGELIALGGTYVPSKIMSQDIKDVTVKVGLQQRETVRAQVRTSVVKSLKEKIPVELSKGSNNGLYTFEQQRKLCYLSVLSDSASNAKSETAQEIIDNLATVQLVRKFISENERIFSIRSTYKDIVEDVEPDLLSVREMVRMLTAFKENFREKYFAAFVSMSISDLLEPLVLLDIVPTSFNVFPFKRRVETKKATEEEEGGRGGLGLGFGLGFHDNGSHDRGSAEAKDGDDFIDDDGYDDGQENGVFKRPFQSISDRDWHEPLGEFSSAAESSGADVMMMDTSTAPEADADANLLPNVVTSVVMPWLGDIIGSVMDPYSTEHCDQCQRLLAEVLDYDPLPEDFSLLLQALVSNFHRHMESICIPIVKIAKVPAVTATISSSGKSNSDIGRYFVGKQLFKVLKYLQNLSKFQDFLTAAVLAKEAWWVLAVQAIGGLAKLLQQAACDVEEYLLVLKVCKVSMSLIKISEVDFQQCGVAVLQYKLLQIALSNIAKNSEDGNEMTSSNTIEWTANKVLLADVLNKMTY